MTRWQRLRRSRDRIGSRACGFTLAEVLISIALVGLLVAEMAALFDVGLRSTTSSTVKNENERVAATALQIVMDEVRQATSIEEPRQSSVPAADLSFTRPAPDGTSMTFHVRYLVVDNRLERKTWDVATEPPSSPENTMQILNGVNALEYTVEDDPLFLTVRVTADLRANAKPSASATPGTDSSSDPSPHPTSAPAKARPTVTAVTMSGCCLLRVGL